MCYDIKIVTNIYALQIYPVASGSTNFLPNFFNFKIYANIVTYVNLYISSHKFFA